MSTGFYVYETDSDGGALGDRIWGFEAQDEAESHIARLQQYFGVGRYATDKELRSNKVFGYIELCPSGCGFHPGFGDDHEDFFLEWLWENEKYLVIVE